MQTIRHALGFSPSRGLNSTFPRSKQEPVIVLVLITAFVVISLFTASRYPTAWVDEDLYTDPAANLLAGQGFTSSEWPGQGSHAFWTGNVPLHAILLYGWMRFFGFGLVSARSMNYFLMALAAFLLWLSVKRLRLIQAAWCRVLFVIIIFSAAGPTISYRSARPDCIGIVLFAAAVLTMTIERKRLRYGLLLILGFLFPWAGLQLVFYGAIFCGLIVVFSKGSHLQACAMLGLGIIAGLFSLFAFYSLLGVWASFLKAITVYNDVGGRRLGLSQRLIAMPFALTVDKSLLMLFVLAIGLTLAKVFQRKFSVFSYLSFGLAAGFFIPAGMFLAGKFPIYYSWMAVIPLSACLLSEISLWKPVPRQNPGQLLVLASFLVVILVGLPMRLFFTFYEWRFRDYHAVESAMARNSLQAGSIVTDFKGYFAAKKTRSTVILLSRLPSIPPIEKQQVTLLLIDPKNLESVEALLGGKWMATSDRFAPPLRPSPFGLTNLYRSYKDKAQSCDYDLQIYRRLPGG